jgi:hypothetical protein
MKLTSIILLFISVTGLSTSGQVDMGGMQMNMSADTMKMNSSFSLNLHMNRDGSGTSWQPDDSPMRMYMKTIHRTTLAIHGAIFIRYTAQGIAGNNQRGGKTFDAPNWMMFMLQQKINDKNLFSFLSMFSLDRLTEGGSGYPLLFQTGETYKNIPLVDRQHPHDLFAELAVNFTSSIKENIDVSAYLGYPGEPALGPVTFMHRLSASGIPDAPIGHHWQDATHITFGVGTLAFRYKTMKVEGSLFTGREPDEDRYNLDKPRFDSYSYRLSINAHKRFALQFSQGFIKSPETTEPMINVIRTTASIQFVKTFRHKELLATSLVWGMNNPSEGNKMNSLVLESNLELKPFGVFARYEFVQKDRNELQLFKYNQFTIFNIIAATLGFNKILLSSFNTDFSLGFLATLYFPGKMLSSIYGSNPLAGECYIRITPAISIH